MTETATHKTHGRSTWIRAGLIAFAFLALAGGLIYWRISSLRVYVDTASIEAPLIDLSPSQPGTLEDVYAQVGDQVNANTTVARVDNELIKTKVAGIVVSITEKTGGQVNPNQAVVTMVDPSALRVVGEVDENKGLSRIAVGDPISFTVDAFGSKVYSGVIDEISPTAKSSGVVFNISNQRETQQFDVKARFDIGQYPELRNGMSARMWIYTH